MKLGFLRVWPSVLGLAAVVGLASASTGCIIVADDNDDDVVVVENPPPVTEPMLVTIDSDEVLESTPGDGVGVFVEYSVGGTWRLWTTCDTLYTNRSCSFDIFATVDTASKIGVVQDEGLEGADFVNVDGTAGLQFFAETALDIDSVAFTSTPGAILRVEVNLDGAPQPNFIYWIGNGVIHEGAPTSPVDFEPSVP